LAVLAACATVLAFAGGAWAVDANVVLREGGASAQGDFLVQNAGEYLAQELSCDRVCRNSIPGDNTSFIIKGFNCDFDSDPDPNDDTITIYIQGIGSSFGCENAPGSQTAAGWIDEANCQFTEAAGCDGGGVDVLNNCEGPKISARLHVGCSDIQCASIVQTTTGYRNGRRGFNAEEALDDFGNAAGIPPSSITPNADMVLFSPFIVPFGYIANNQVTKTRCVAPVVPANALNEPKFYDCVEGSENPRVIGTCADGVRNGLGCTKNEHCPASGDLLYDFLGAQCVPGAQRCIPKADPQPDELPGSCDLDESDCALSTQYELNPQRFAPDQPWLRLVANSCPPVEEAQSGDPSSECVGFYKCVGPELISGDDPDDLQRTCVGGARAGQPCDTAAECPVERAATACVARPIDNLSRMQALLLFAGQVKNWRDFGPWYPDLPVALCMRHGGSGTHATKDLRVMRGDRALATVSKTLAPTDPSGASAVKPLLPILWHYRSSTTLTEDCVEYYDGGVGYVDADKALNNDFTSNVHHLKHEGVEPVRQKVIFGEYPFWGAASCFYDDDSNAGLTQAQKSLATDLLNWLADQNERFEFPTNLFWASGAEMTVSAPNDFAYPSKN
jgi:hypothetical protein